MSIHVRYILANFVFVLCTDCEADTAQDKFLRTVHLYSGIAYVMLHNTYICDIPFAFIDCWAAVSDLLPGVSDQSTISDHYDTAHGSTRREHPDDMFAARSLQVKAP